MHGDDITGLGNVGSMLDGAERGRLVPGLASLPFEFTWNSAARATLTNVNAARIAISMVFILPSFHCSLFP
jgi:hypothetical protein